MGFTFARALPYPPLTPWMPDRRWASSTTAQEDPMARIAILTGDTFPVRNILNRYWTWSPERKAWTIDVDADATSESTMSRYVRGLAGIRNRGSFSITIDG